MTEVNNNATNPDKIEQDTNYNGSQGENTQKELVGDVLRKERVTRRINVETIARDLKLNVKYIKALEANDYDSLPADPYVRVYLKSIAKYLSLNPDDIIKRFYKERGIDIEEVKEKPSRVEVTSSSTVTPPENSNRRLWIVAVIIIGILIIISLIGKKQGWLKAPEGPLPIKSDSIDNEFKRGGNISDSTIDDSLIPAKPPFQDEAPKEKESVKSSTSSTIKKDSVNTSSLIKDTTKQTQPMILVISVVKDSVWLQVFSDGVSWKNIVYKNQNRMFSAKDSFNIHVGNVSAIKASLNNKLLVLEGKGVGVYKIDSSGKVYKRTLAEWNSVFKGRI
ncbi:MAG: helix-turn-helix domain-containing protein [Chitinispirillaceae bacterium]|nr:helix-turn-helix domain-containing protein [Chitinispirillaceae bacterium]